METSIDRGENMKVCHSLRLDVNKSICERQIYWYQFSEIMPERFSEALSYAEIRFDLCSWEFRRI